MVDIVKLGSHFEIWSNCEGLSVGSGRLSVGSGRLSVGSRLSFGWVNQVGELDR